MRIYMIWEKSYEVQYICKIFVLPSFGNNGSDSASAFDSGGGSCRGCGRRRGAER